MNAKKNMIRAIIAMGIVLVIYCILAFVMPFQRGTVFWLSFVFTVIALLVQIFVLKTAFAHGEDARSKFYGFPIAKVGLIYLVAQLIAGFVCMAMGVLLPVWVAVVLFVLILGAALIGLITVDAIRDEVERQDTELQADVEAMRSLQSKTSSIAAQCQDPVLKKVLTSLAEQFRFSDPVSSEKTAEAESNLAGMVDVLQAAVIERDADSALELISRIEAALAERNELCKLAKRDR